MIVGRPSLREVLGDVDVGAALDELDDGPVWYVSLLSGAAAWVSAGLFIAFLNAADLIKDEGSGLVIGALLTLAAVFLRRQGIQSVFLTQLALATVLAGETLAITAFGNLVQSDWFTMAVAAWFLATMVFAFPDPVHRFGATLGAGTFIGGAIFELSEGFPLHAFATPLLVLAGALWLREPDVEAGRWHAYRAPVAYGAVAGTFGLLLLALWGPDTQRVGAGVTTIGLAVALLGGVWLESQRDDPRLTSAQLAPLAGTVAVLVGLTWSTPGILATLAVMTLAFHRRATLLLGVASAFFAVFLTAFYYDLALSLWTKSGVLVGSGALLLVARLFLTDPEEEP